MLRRLERGLSSISLYTHGTYWKMSNNWETSHSCGGVATILVLVIILALAVTKFIELFNRSTMTLSSLSEINSFFTNTTMATSSFDSSTYPLMVGVRPTKFQLSAEYVNSKDDVTDEIGLEQCLVTHFQLMPNIESIYADTGINTFKCLPLNKKFQLGGNQYANQNSYISIRLSCPEFTTCSSEDQVELLVMYGIPDPYNVSNPVAPIGQIYTFRFPDADKSTSHVVSFIRHVITTDEAIWPLETKQSELTVLEMDENLVEGVTDVNTLGFILSTNQKSTKTQRKYMTLLDVLAYLGGLFGTVVGLFFFMSAYGAQFYQMVFAAQVFGSKQAKQFGFLSYCKKNVYNIIGMFKKKPQWQDVKEEIKIQKAVDRALSLQYLYKRIQFLEKVAAVVLEEHQLQALHLEQRFSKDDNNRNYQAHQLRQKLIKYLKKKGGQRLLKSSRKEQSLKRQQMGNIGESAQNIISNNELDVPNPSKTVPQEGLIELQESEQRQSIFDEVDSGEQQSEDQQSENQQEGEQERKQRKQKLKQKQMQQFINERLSKLIKEAEQGDIRSMRIYRRLDKQMRKCIQRAIHNHQHFVEIKLQTNLQT